MWQPLWQELLPSPRRASPLIALWPSASSPRRFRQRTQGTRSAIRGAMRSKLLATS